MEAEKPVAKAIPRKNPMLELSQYEISSYPIALSWYKNKNSIVLVQNRHTDQWNIIKDPEIS
jgi:hypothetical protein